MNIKQHKFVTEYLRDGNAMVAYWRAYNVKDPNGKAAESAANRLLRHPEIKAAIDESQSRIRNEVEREVAARRVEEVFSIEEKRVLLKKIATGQMMVEQYYKGKDCNMCTQYVRPSIWHVLSAIKEDSRLAGHYPTQQPGKARSLSPLKETSIGQQPSEAVSMRHLERHESSQQKTTKQNATTDKTQGKNSVSNESPLQGDRGTTREEHSQQLSEAPSLSPLKETSISQKLSEAVSLSPLKETSTRQPNTTTDVKILNNESPLKGDRGTTRDKEPSPPNSEPNTITHDELMKLLYPNRHKVKQHY